MAAHVSALYLDSLHIDEAIGLLRVQSVKEDPYRIFMKLETWPEKINPQRNWSC
jgi:hypothetical protein